MIFHSYLTYMLVVVAAQHLRRSSPHRKINRRFLGKVTLNHGNSNRIRSRRFILAIAALSICIYIYIHTYLHDMKQNSIGLSQHVGVFLGKPVRTKYVGYFFHCYVWLRKGSHWLKPHPPFKHPHSFLSQSYAQNHPLPFVAYVLYRKRRVMMVSIFFQGFLHFPYTEHA